MYRKNKFNVGISLLIQSASFILLFFLLYRKKKNLANTLLALAAAGGIAGAYLVLKEAKDEIESCERAAREPEDDGLFDECRDCYGDCSECPGNPTVGAEPDITVEESENAGTAG